MSSGTGGSFAGGGEVGGYGGAAGQGAGGGGGMAGMGSMLSQLGNYDLTLGQAKETGMKHGAEERLLNALIRGTAMQGAQVTSGHSPQAAQVSPWNPMLIQNLLRSFARG